MSLPTPPPGLAAEKAQNDKLGEQFGIRGYPTIVFIGADGKEVSRGGYAKGGPAAWIEKHAVPYPPFMQAALALPHVLWYCKSTRGGREGFRHVFVVGVHDLAVHTLVHMVSGAFVM